MGELKIKAGLGARAWETIAIKTTHKKLGLKIQKQYESNIWNVYASLSQFPDGR